MALKIIAIVVIVLLVARLLLPVMLRLIINKKLSKQKGFNGNVKKIGLGLVRGSIVLEQLSIKKRGEISGSEEDFFSVFHAHLQFRWRSLLKKTFICDLTMDTPRLHIVGDEDGSEGKDQPTFNLKARLEQMPKFTVNISINNGEVFYSGKVSKSKFDLALKNIQFTMHNFSNMPGQNSPLPAQITLLGDVYEGDVDVKLKMDPMADKLTFDLNAEVNNINLVLLNDLLRAQARIDINKGRFGMYAEVAANDGEFNGYIKPIFRELDLVGAEDKNDGLVTRLWEGFVAVMIQFLKNKSSDQVGTRISISGKVDDPHINVVSAILTILKNGFIQSLKPSIDDVINVDSVRNSFQKGKEFLRDLIR